MCEDNASDRIPFCCEDIAKVKTTLLCICEALPKYRKQYETHKNTGSQKELSALAELQKTVKRMFDGFLTLRQALLEYGDESLTKTADRLNSAVRKFDYLGAATYEPLCNALYAFADKLPVPGDDRINLQALAHLANRAKMGYYPTDTGHIDLIKSGLVFPTETVSVIDPCCGEGIALQRLTADENAVTYGVELDEVRGEEAQKRLNRVGFGSYFHSRISLNAFQLMLLNPPYLSVPSEHGNRRLEKSFLADAMRLLEIDGVMIYIIPYYRASYDVCRTLVDNFADIRVYRFVGSEFDRFRQVAIIGRRIKRREAIKAADRLTEYMLEPDSIPTVRDIKPGLYQVPKPLKNVELFKGAVFNEAELAEQLKKSTSHKVLFSKSILDSRERYPLLPLNLSQIGLVGASGLMNGLVDCEFPHIIKGRIVKEKKSRLTAPDNHNKCGIREVTTNKLIFNVLTANGMKSLG